MIFITYGTSVDGTYVGGTCVGGTSIVGMSVGALAPNMIKVWDENI